MKVYTRKGDDGTTGLLFGGRVLKNSELPTAYGAVDEAQAFIGLARAECAPGSELDELLVTIERDLWVLMAELATLPENRGKLTPGQNAVDHSMIARLESVIDDIGARFDPPTEFVVPGGNRVAALLDVARTVVRRAERAAVPAVPDAGLALPYLNRLSDLLWTLARWQEGESLRSRSAGR